MGAYNRKVVDRAVDAAILYKLTDRLYRARAADEVHDAALDAIMESLGCSRASILLFDDAGVMRFVASRGLSEHYRTTLEDHSPWRQGEPDPSPLFVSDIDNTDEPDWVKAAVKKEGISALAFIPLVAQGRTVGKFMTYYDAPRTFPAGEIELAVTIARQVGFSVERAMSERARHSAEQRLHESQDRFHLMCEHAPVMIWMSDAKGGCLQLNNRLREFWGVGDTDLDLFDWASTMHPDDAPAIGMAMGEALAKYQCVSLKGRYRNADGEYRVLQTDARPRLSAEGEFLGMIGVNIDITEREEAEEARRHAAAHTDLLVAELNHRVKNTLSVVQAIAYQTFRGTADEACHAFSGRLAALARSHDLLTQSSWERVSFHSLAATALQAQDGAEPRIHLHGPAVLLRPRHAVALGMALHELFTNAVKHGALSNDHGTVSLNWTVSDNPRTRLQITWREQGGPPVAPPTRTGFGSMLLERILKGDLDAIVVRDFQSTGLVCSITTALMALEAANSQGSALRSQADVIANEA